MAADVAAAVPGRDARVIGLVGAGHFLSHFYILALPPLFPLLKEEFGVGYAALGAALTLYNLAAGMAQAPVGFLVDRIGARTVLTLGLAVEAAAVAFIGLSSSFGALLALLFVAGLADSVFHPSDYAILNASVRRSRLGRAFSLHTFAGYVGFAVAPGTMILLTGIWSWRAGLVIAGGVGLAVALVMLFSRDLLDNDARRERPAGDAGAQRRNGGIGLLFSPPVLVCFLFYVATSMGSGGLQTFSVSALVSIYDAPLAAANAALSGFLVASALGILLGGVVADRIRRHGLAAGLGFAGAALGAVVVATTSLGPMLLVGVFGFAGLVQGMARPSRDMMVRALTPEGASGRVFGFVCTGLNVGGAVSPLLFGWVIDLGAPRLVFVLAAVFLLVAAGLAVLAGTRWGNRKSEGTQDSAP
ncbi:MAG: MFS transporter, partial [Alphaproteobacteria bacterium]